MEVIAGVFYWLRWCRRMCWQIKGAAFDSSGSRQIHHLSLDYLPILPQPPGSLSHCRNALYSLLPPAQQRGSRFCRQPQRRTGISQAAERHIGGQVIVREVPWCRRRTLHECYPTHWWRSSSLAAVNTGESQCR